MQKTGMKCGIAFFMVWVLFSGAVLAQGSPNVPLLKQLNSYASSGYNDCWGYIKDGREYALLGVKSGTSIVDITDAANAQEVTFIGSAFSSWKDIKTYQHYAYTMTEANKILQIIDLSNLPNSATLVNSFTLGTSGNPHNIYIDEPAGILYVSDDFRFNTSVHVYSLADPVNPVALTQFGPDSHDMYAQDGVLFVAEGSQPSIGIFDVSNPASPSLINRLVIPSAGYVHNVWPTADNQFIMTTEETSGKTVKYWDISDVNNPVLRDDYLGPNGLAHNAHIKGNYSYISHYGAGLRIVDISDPDNIFEAGFYDTQSAWGGPGFFPSGKVLISDISNGLYVVFFEGAVEQLTFQENLREGWNMIGLPYEPDDNNVAALFPNHTPGSLYSFNGSYVSETSLNSGSGYWLRFPAAETVGIQGSVIDNLTLSLNQGWNMISGLSCDIALGDVDDPGGIIVPGTLYGFNGAYVTADSIAQGNGYWLRASAAGDITLSCGTAALPKQPSAAALLEIVADFGKITLSDAQSGASQTLWFGEALPGNADVRSYSLPPLPADGAFDARFAGDMRIATGETAEIHLAATGAVTLEIANWLQDGYRLQALRSAMLVDEYPLFEGQHIRLPAINRLRLLKDSAALPTAYLLEQNYPNPFNPSTLIRYELPERSDVTLTVYNALGQAVRTLVAGEQPAGSYQVRWDGRNASGNISASGVYFYRLSAGNFNQVRQMLLMQ